MNWVTWWSGMALGCAVGFALLQAWRIRDPHDYVSDAWLAEMEQRELQDGIDGVCWQWPVGVRRGGRRA